MLDGLLTYSRIVTVGEDFELAETGQLIGEQQHQLQFLQEHGCDRIQGDYIGKPVKQDEIVEICKQINI